MEQWGMDVGKAQWAGRWTRRWALDGKLERMLDAGSWIGRWTGSLTVRRMLAGRSRECWTVDRAPGAQQDTERWKGLSGWTADNAEQEDWTLNTTVHARQKHVNARTLDRAFNMTLDAGL